MVWTGKKIKDWKVAEQMVYWLIWMVVIFLPLIFLDFGDFHQRKRIIGGWVRILPFLMIFLIHHLVLLPQLLNKNKKSTYLIGTLALILIVNYLFVFNTVLHDSIYNLLNSYDTAAGPRLPSAQGHHRGPGIGFDRGRHFDTWSGAQYWLYTSNIFISLLIVGFNATLYYTTRWLREEQKRKEIEKQSMHSQLTALQHQVSPHFFMNTLNNIHALIDYNSEDAKDAVLRLSELMRYVLYDSEDGKTTLQKEVDFLKSYIDLMKLRISESLDLSVKLPEKIPHITLPPFLFIPFIENAFKHGIGTEGNSFIHILIEIENGKIHFSVRNSKPASKIENGVFSGIGIENARKRLNLLFNGKHALQILEREKDFEVDLIFPYEN
jgi:hypothetical protein